MVKRFKGGIELREQFLMGHRPKLYRSSEASAKVEVTTSSGVLLDAPIRCPENRGVAEEEFHGSASIHRRHGVAWRGRPAPGRTRSEGGVPAQNGGRLGHGRRQHHRPASALELF